jgi:SAM-dependent methyltransferase
MSNPTVDPIHSAVREHYAGIARAQQSDDACCSSGCCDSLYAAEELAGLPGSVTELSLGCGDPVSLADIRLGDTVLDLGSGGGIDCFLAARRAGPSGRVIGIDMTDEMLDRARANAARLNATTVEFRQGQIEALPIDDSSVDVVLSNCVINLSPNKPQVFREMYRALKPGGRLAVSDIVTNGVLPDAVRQSLEAWGACIAGALDVKDYVAGLEAAGFVDVKFEPKGQFAAGLAGLPVHEPFSALVTARKDAR